MRRIAVQDQAASLVEYAVLAAAIAGACIAVIAILGLNVANLFSTTLSSIPF